ncbi:MAG: hypothetical protein COA78_38335 [Blastopirellula sp.]|nr:MAG: hypothetical protein COA78_38335 [Blastopirellula sp.]
MIRALILILGGLMLTAGGCSITPCQQSQLDQLERGLVKGQELIVCEGNLYGATVKPMKIEDVFTFAR